MPQLVTADEAADALGVQPHTVVLVQRWPLPTVGRGGELEALLRDTEAALGDVATSRWDRSVVGSARARSIRLSWPDGTSQSAAAADGGAAVVLEWTNAVRTCAHRGALAGPQADAAAERTSRRRGGRGLGNAATGQ